MITPSAHLVNYSITFTVDFEHTFAVRISSNDFTIRQKDFSTNLFLNVEIIFNFETKLVTMISMFTKTINLKEGTWLATSLLL